MFSSPAKRRRTGTPTRASLPGPSASATTTPIRRPATRDGAMTTPARPSFLSPTKASLARFHPQLLPSSQLQGPEERPMTPSRAAPARALVEDMGVGNRSNQPVGGAIEKLGLEELEVQVALEDREQVSEALLTTTPAPSEPAKEPPAASATAQGAVEDSENMQSDQELDLPLTPSQRGLPDPAAAVPPAGLDNTPSGRSKRRAVMEKKMSPRKNRRLTEEQEQEDLKAERARDAQRHIEQALDPEEVDLEKAEKEKERDKLLAQLQELEADVKFMARGIMNINRQGADSSGPLSKDSEGLLVLLLKATEQLPSEPPPKPAPVSKKLATFLPFSRRPRFRKPDLDDLNPPEILSHRPVEVPDPLPHLQVFTPLSFTSTTTLLPLPDQISCPILRQQEITLSSPGSFLNASLSMTVDTALDSIDRLELTHLSKWAEPELGTWVRKRAQGGSPAGKDVLGVCYASGAFWEMAERRAKVWWKCHEAFPTLLDTKELPLGKRRRSSCFIGEGGGLDGLEPSKGPAPDELVPHLGTTMLTFRDAKVVLSISWHISFDWTGEAQSELSATSSVPEGWRKVDERDSLNQISVVFEGLVKSLGVFDAVKAVIKLLFPPK